MSARQPHDLLLAAQQTSSTSGDLIKVRVSEIGGVQVQTVEARDLYLGLGLARAEWSRWAARNIEADAFFVKNKDWVGFVFTTSGNDIQDYAISLEFAKHLAMMARTEKAHDYRNYFIECERRALAAPALPNFADPAAAARAWADEVEAKLTAESKVAQLAHMIEVQAPAVEGFDRIANAAGTSNLSATAKVLQLQPSQLIAYLLEKKWIFKGESKSGNTWYIAFQDKLDAKYLSHKFGSYQDPYTSEWKSKEQVMVTRKGAAKLAAMLACDAVTKRMAAAPGQHQQRLPLPGDDG